MVEVEIRKEKETFRKHSSDLLTIKQQMNEKKKVFKTELIETLRSCYVSKQVY